MADECSIDTSALDALAASMDALATTELEAVDRAGLRAVGAYVKPALVEVTPKGHKWPRGPHSNSLQPGELAESVRARVVQGDGRGAASVVDFGRNTYVARFLDSGTSHAAAIPFIRTLQDNPVFQGKAQEAYVAGAQTAVDEVMDGRG